MDASFKPVEIVPGKTPFGLDQLRRSYKSELDAASAIAAAPAVGTADEDFPNMFLMPISTPESAESATRIDLVYMGCLAGAEGSPVLPDQKHVNGNAVQSGSSSRGSSGATLTSPITIQYYAPSTQLTFFTFGAPGTKGQVADPTDNIEFISITLGDTSFTPTGIPAEIAANFFIPLITDTLDSEEIVPGQYWQNTERKIKSLSPWLFTLTPGNYIFLSSGGSGYFVGNSLTINDGTSTATMHVDTVNSYGAITSFTTTSNSFTYDTPLYLYASGGSGSGAAFVARHIA